MTRASLIAIALLAGLLGPSASAPPPNEDGYELWLRYRRVENATLRSAYRSAITHVVIDTTASTLRVARDELTLGLGRMIGVPVSVQAAIARSGALVVGTPASSPEIAKLGLARDLEAVGPDGYLIRATTIGGRRATVIAANREIGAVYGAFHLLRLVATGAPIRELRIANAPKIQYRMLDHWDNLDRSVERGYAGQSLWEWAALPDSISPRYRDYARANASVGINAVALTNVNANATVLTAAYLTKVAAIADVFRPYGIRVFLTARFSAPIEIGGLATADPKDAGVGEWWKRKADEIYDVVPDFGGFVVKANSEGQPGPQDYRRSHADGANMLADAVAPHGGVVMWRAFVYSNEVPVDRVRQAYDEFQPLDGAFRDNVMIQVKNGALDFQPREPFHPLFGAMPQTPLVMELQITKEYLGMDTHLAYLGPLFEEVLDADTWAAGKGSTVAKVIDGSLHRYARTGIAGVSNVGTDRNWTGSHLNQANWYVFGRLAWDPSLSASAIAEEWIRMTLSTDPAVIGPVRRMMLASREAVVNYMTPLGLAHQMARNHHYGPGPWVAGGGREDWTSVYYARADTIGLGFDRTAAGSNAVGQYFPPVRDRYGNRATVPDSVLLWFHRVRWNERLASGRTLWDELLFRYQTGVDTVRWMQRTWETLQGEIDDQRFREIRDFLAIQEKEARWWRDASVTYFQRFSRMPLPAGYERPAHDLDYYMRLRCPADVTKPRCALR
jgi:alpha-glucuronidase